MHLTALIDSPEHVCCRYRLAAFRPFFERAGHRLHLASLPRRWWRRLWHAGAKRCDVAILQRRLLSAVELHLLRRNTRRLIFDFDDAIWLHDSYAVKGPRSDRRLRRFVATVRAADVVIAGNEFLAEQARRFTDSGGVHVIPTCVNPEFCPQADQRGHGDGARLVWVGSSSTLRGLEQLRGHLEDIGRHVERVRLKLVCDRFLSFQHLPVEACRWNRATESLEIAAADIGIAWMPDDDWSRGKCGLKVLQYLAAGLPVVANPVGVHREMIRHGENGFLATTPAEWIDAIRTLAADANLRARMGAAGRRLVEMRYSVARAAEMWLPLLNGLSNTRQAA